jgi:hypothetical protein
VQFFNLNAGTIAQGSADFHTYARAMICGTYDEAAYEAAMDRRGGVIALPGAITAAIKFGINDKAGVIHAVSRTTRCSRDTVEKFLDAFTGSKPGRHLFRESDGHLSLHREVRFSEFPNTIFFA